MGYGDRLMAIGDAAAIHAEHGGKVAIGDGVRAEWCTLCEGLDFVAKPEEVTPDTRWVISANSMRPYIDYPRMRAELDHLGHDGARFPQKKLVGLLGRYLFRSDYRAKPAPVVLNAVEREIAGAGAAAPYIAIEPYIKARAPVNKQWPVERFHDVAAILAGHRRVVQVSAPGLPDLYPGIERANPASFRHAMAWIAGAQLYIGPEGGLHHAAAAVGTPAVVIFGGFTDPKVVGYDAHVNLTGDARYACGTKQRSCPHCVKALRAITVNDVVTEAQRLLTRPAR